MKNWLGGDIERTYVELYIIYKSRGWRKKMRLMQSINQENKRKKVPKKERADEEEEN